MFKKFLVILSMFASALAFAAVDVNKANQADLDGIKGIGPGTAQKILDARKAGPFKDWADLESRVSGIKDKRAAKLSEAGLTVNGASFAGAPAKADKKDKKDKKADKAAAAASAPAAAPAAPAAPAPAPVAAAKAAAAAAASAVVNPLKK